MNQLYVLTTVFNPRRFASRYRLYQQFSRWVASYSVRLLTIEIAFGERPHAVTQQSDPWHIQLSSTHEIWQKERALNLGLWRLSQLDPGWQYVGWLDADVKLLRDDWAEEAVHLLQHYAVVQLFGEVQTLDPQHHTIYGGRSIARNWYDTGSIKSAAEPGHPYGWSGWPGLGWAFRRDELSSVGGWLDVCVAGSGDTYMAGAYLGLRGLGVQPGMSEGFRRVVEQYHERCERVIRQNVGYVPGLLVHSWHGRASQRGYNDRNGAKVVYSFDPGTDLRVDASGLYRWNLDVPRVRQMAAAVRRSMAARNEDGNEV